MTLIGDSLILQFYVLGDPMLRSAVYGQVKGECLDLLRDGERGRLLPNPMVISIGGGTALRDFIWASRAPIISETVIRLLTENSISGWTVYPVNVVDKGGNEVSGYFGLGVTGRCAWVGFDRHEEALVWRANRSTGTNAYFSGLQLPVDSWDGTDIFVGEDLSVGGSWIVVTQRVFDIFRKHRVTNYELRPLEKVELLAQQSAIIRTA